MIRRVAFVLAAAAALAATVARADPLPESGPLALQVFFDGCLDPAGARKDPAPLIERALAGYKHETAQAAADPAHPERKLWKVRGVDGDLELETFTGKAWCEVRLIGADPGDTVRKLNNALARVDMPMQRKSLPGDAPGVTDEAVLLGRDAADGILVKIRQAREPRDGEPGLILSASPLQGSDGQNPDRQSQ